jgi:ABC-type multidrug transport system ATPase subunit
MRILAGLVIPEKGQLRLHGKTLESPSGIHRDAGFFIEGPDFYNHLDARQNLLLLKGIRKDQQSVFDLLRVVGIEYAAEKKVGKFSNGMKQRLGVAQALLGDPALLVLDEPFNGLDPEVKQFLMDLIRQLAQEKNKAILVSSHLLTDLEAIADDFLLLSQGQVHAAGSINDYKQEQQTVCFWFEKEPPLTLLEENGPGKILHSQPWCWQTQLDIPETALAVKKWALAGCAPYEIERADLLHSKYSEIIP